LTLHQELNPFSHDKKGFIHIYMLLFLFHFIPIFILLKIPCCSLGFYIEYFCGTWDIKSTRIVRKAKCFTEKRIRNTFRDEFFKEDVIIFILNSNIPKTWCRRWCWHDRQWFGYRRILFFSWPWFRRLRYRGRDGRRSRRRSRRRSWRLRLWSCRGLRSCCCLGGCWSVLVVININNQIAEKLSGSKQMLWYQRLVSILLVVSDAQLGHLSTTKAGCK
jgi:hypothetical protein